MIFGNNGTTLIAPTSVEDNHTTAVAPATYVITVDLFSVSSHLSAIVANTSSALNFSARAIVVDRSATAGLTVIADARRAFVARRTFARTIVAVVVSIIAIVERFFLSPC